MKRRGGLATVLSILLMGCASRPSSTPLAAPSPARCRTVGDSIAARANMDSLPTGAFRHSFAGPGLPGGLRRGERVTIRFVVRPDGTPDLASLKILGSDDAGYRQRVERAIRRADLLPMRVNGCPVFSLVEVTIAKAG